MGAEALNFLAKDNRVHLKLLVLPNEVKSKVLAPYRNHRNVKVLKGDLRCYDDVRRGVEGVDYVLHVGALIPPAADRYPELAEQVNANVLEAVDVAVTSPAEIIFLADNFTSDVQSPAFFNEWSRAYYVEAYKRIHAAGKYTSSHCDGKLRGLLKSIHDAGGDCIDAVTPAPMGDLTPEECREEAGPDLILSGGVSPDLWRADGLVEEFKEAVIRWVELKKYSPRLIAAAGDQVPPGAPEDRIEIMRDLVEKHGRY